MLEEGEDSKENGSTVLKNCEESAICCGGERLSY